MSVRKAGAQDPRCCGVRFHKAGLDERLQELAQQVSDFAGQHEKQAAALQEQLEHLETQVGLLTKQYANIAADYKALWAFRCGSDGCYGRPGTRPARQYGTADTSHLTNAGTREPTAI